MKIWGPSPKYQASHYETWIPVSHVSTLLVQRDRDRRNDHSREGGVNRRDALTEVTSHLLSLKATQFCFEVFCHINTFTQQKRDSVDSTRACFNFGSCGHPSWRGDVVHVVQIVGMCDGGVVRGSVWVVVRRVIVFLSFFLFGFCFCFHFQDLCAA